MASSNHDCCSSSTVNLHSFAGTPSLQMEYAPPPLQTVISCQAIPSCLDFDDLFLFTNLGFDDSIAQAEPLPVMVQSEEDLWSEERGGEGIASGDLSSGNGIVANKSNFCSFPTPLSPTISSNSHFEPDSSFSPLPNTHATQNEQPLKHSQNQQQLQQKAVKFIVEGDGNSLYDGYSWRKHGEKSIKHRDYRRSYYRCGHSGCMVKKQVEQSSEKPTEYLITYYGHHNHYSVTEYSNIGYN